MPRFFYPHHPLFAPQKTLSLPPSISEHVKAFRLRVGDVFRLFDGLGAEWQVKLLSLDRREAIVLCEFATPALSESPLSIHLAQGIARGDKMDWMLQKATELGVSAVTPLSTHYCNVKISDERKDNKTHHWEKIIHSSSEQCGRSYLMQLHPVQTLEEWVTSFVPQHPSTLKCVLHPEAPDCHLKQLPWPSTEKSIALVIGPEGGLSPAELNVLAHHGFLKLSLGPRILRSETAGLAAASALQLMYGDL